MSTVDKFITKQKANSPFISIKNGESIVVKRLKNITIASKPGYDGAEKEILRLTCLVDTPEGEREKNFDNGSVKFPLELQAKGIDVGDSFTITRSGEGAKTVYIITGVVKPAGTVTSTAPTQSAPAPTTPKA